MKHTCLALVLTASLVLPGTGGPTVLAAGSDTEEFTEKLTEDAEKGIPASSSAKGFLATKTYIALGVIAVVASAALLWKQMRGEVQPPKKNMSPEQQEWEGLSRAYDELDKLCKVCRPSPVRRHLEKLKLDAWYKWKVKENQYNIQAWWRVRQLEVPEAEMASRVAEMQVVWNEPQVQANGTQGLTIEELQNQYNKANKQYQSVGIGTWEEGKFKRLQIEAEYAWRLKRLQVAELQASQPQPPQPP